MIKILTEAIISDLTLISVIFSNPTIYVDQVNSKMKMLTHPGNLCDILKMRLFRILGTAVLLESLKKFEQYFLRDFTPSSL